MKTILSTYDYIQFLYDHQKFPRHLLEEKTAEIASMCSDTEELLFYKNPDLSAYDTVCFIGSILLATPPRQQYLQFELFEKLNLKVFKFKGQGNWKLVETLVCTKNLTPYLYFQELEKHFCQEDLFGNILGKIEKLAKLLRIKKIITVTEDQRPVKEKVFRRGYNDKGNLPVSHPSRNHENHGDQRRNETEPYEGKIVPPPRKISWFSKKDRR